MRQTSRHCLVVVVLAAAVLSQACSRTPAAPAVTPDTWAVVGTRQIMRAEVDKAFERNRDPNQVMSRQTQLDLANELVIHANHPAAAAAYEAYLRQYSRGGERIEQIQLMLGIIYARYLQKPDRARELLTAAVDRLSGERELSIAREELSKLTPPSSPPSSRHQSAW